MCNNWPFATHGTLIDLDFHQDLSSSVLANNDKAALFGTLDLLFSLPGCVRLFWSFAESRRSRIIILIDWSGHYLDHGRPALPKQRLEQFLSEPPRVYEVIFPSGLRFLRPGMKISTTIYDSQSPHAVPGVPATSGRAIPRYTVDALDAETWRKNASRISHIMHINILDAPAQSSLWPDWMRGGVRTASKQSSPGLDLACPGTVRLYLTPQEYSVPRRASRERVQTSPEPEKVLDSHEESIGCKEDGLGDADEEDWVILSADELQ